MTRRSAIDGPTTRERGGPVDPRLLRHASAARGFFAQIAVLSLLQTAAIVGFAWLMTDAVVGAVAGRDLTGTLAGLAVVVAARGILLWLREAAATRAAARVQAQLRSRLLDAIDQLGPGWLPGTSTARLAVIAGRGLEALDAYFSRYLPQLAQTAIATPILVVVMLWQDWISGLTVVITIPLIPLFMVLIGMATRSVQQRQWQTLGRLAARFTDTVHGLSTLKVFGRQHRAVRSIAAVTERYRQETMRVLRVSFLSGFALELLASISVALIAVSIGFRLLDDSMPLAVGLFVLLLAPEAYLPLRQVGVQFHAAAEGVAATDDIFAVLDAAHEAPARRAASAPASGDLLVAELRVRRGERMLSPVSFRATPGTVTLLRGPSGSGKSSLLAALRGAADATGSAAFGGADVAELAPAGWLAWAGQQPGLVTGTIAENVALGDPEPDAALVATALSHACATELDAARQLGVLGAGLSGGQAQRVAVARALYRHLRGTAPVIALDEPSAALDSRTESALWQSVRMLADRGATVLLVSHRRSAVEIADQIVDLTPEGSS